MLLLMLASFAAALARRHEANYAFAALGAPFAAAVI